MSEELIESGFLIHQRPYRERSLLLELFTIGMGRISAVCRMSKKGEASYRARLRSFVPLDFTLIKGRSELLILKEVQVRERVAAIATPEIFCAEYLNELLYYLYRDDVGDPKLFACYMRVLEILRSSPSKEDLEDVLRKFELLLLDTLGYAPDFRCIDGLWDNGSYYTFLPDTGFVKTNTLEPSFILGDDLNELQRGESLSPRARRALKIITSRALAVLLKGKSLKSRELYADFLKLTSG